MQNALNSNESRWIWLHKNFKIQIQKGGPNNSDILQNWFPKKLGPHSLIWRKFMTLTKLLLNHAEYNEI